MPSSGLSVEYWDKVLSNYDIVDLSKRKIGDAQIPYLSESLKKNNTLISLNLKINKIGPIGAQALSESLIINNTLIELNLCHNKLGDLGTQYLSEALKKNQTLRSFNLTYNELSDVGAYYLSKALKKNISLTNLDLYFNYFRDPRIRDEIAEELKQNNSGEKKRKFECGILLLACRTLIEDSVLYKDSFPLDLFKIIWKLSEVF